MSMASIREVEEKMERAPGVRGATMSHDKNEPSTAIDYLELARASFAQVRSTRDVQTARVLARMGQTYLDKAKAMGGKQLPAVDPSP